MITGVNSDCGSVFNGANDRLTIGLHSRDVLQGMRMMCINTGSFYRTAECFSKIIKKEE